MNDPAAVENSPQLAEPDFEMLDALFRATEQDQQARELARVVLAEFANYYTVSRRFPQAVKAAFEARDWPTTVRLSRDRLGLYTACLEQLAPLLHAGLPEVATDERLWELAEADYLVDIANRYEADFAFAFWHSLRRMLLQNEWKPVSYEAGEIEHRLRAAPRAVLKTFHDRLPIGPEVVRRILEIPDFGARWRDLDADAVLVGEAIAEALAPLHPLEDEAARIEIADSGFYRDRGACLVGRICLGPRNGAAARQLPLLIALLNDKDGLFVDAVLSNTDELQYAFSSTLANVHASCPYYHEVAQFLFELMPKRPLGLHYSTIGFHHLGKVAVMTEILAEHRRSKEKFDTAPGFKGTVAIGFTMPSSGYVLKIIRDHPTDDYKWDYFDGVDTVLGKYHRVHEIDRAGSMLDNVIYSRVKLDRTLFASGLLDELLEAGVGTVSLDRSAVVFRHLIVQVKLTPLPLFLQKATPEQARIAAINLGECIKNNAAANIFNKDLDGRNYGVSKISKVYLFDYDAVGPLTDVKVRTNSDREDGEEGIPEWYFEQGNILLPEEIVGGLRIDDPSLRRAFREAHPELLRVDYWEGMQRALREGKVPKVMNYPASRRLRR